MKKMYIVLSFLISQPFIHQIFQTSFSSRSLASRTFFLSFLSCTFLQFEDQREHTGEELLLFRILLEVMFNFLQRSVWNSQNISASTTGANRCRCKYIQKKSCSSSQWCNYLDLNRRQPWKKFVKISLIESENVRSV